MDAFEVLLRVHLTVIIGSVSNIYYLKNENFQVL